MTRPALRHSRWAVFTLVLAISQLVGARAYASYAASATVTVASSAQIVPRATAPLAAANGSTITVSWPATTLSGGTPAPQHTVRRYDTAGVLLVTLPACAIGGATSCIDTGVAAGSYAYTVQAGVGAWLGAESALSPTVLVSAQSFALTSSATITALPSVVTGTLGAFAVDELLTFRLDSPTGALLTGSPTVVASSTAQAVSMTVPAGTSDTNHAIYAIGSRGSIASVAVRISVAPVLQSIKMRDVNSNGRVDQVVATFSEPLAPYSAGLAPWTLTNVPSSGSLASVTVTGSVATLILSEGVGTATTAAGTFTVAMVANSSGVRDLNDNLASFSAIAPADTAPPALLTMVLQDVNANGKIDQITTTYSETLATYLAGSAPWTLTNVPSGGTLSTVSVSGSTATLALAEGGGAADTSVGTMTVAMATNVTGIRDSAGNLTSITGRAPSDGAAPIPTAITDTNGSTDGRFESGDAISITFTEPLATNLAATTTVTLKDPSGNGSDTVTITGVSGSARSLGSDGYEALNKASAAFANSPVTFSGANRTITITLGPACAGSGCGANLLTQSTAATYSFLAATGLTDTAGNPSTKVLTVSIRMF